MITKRRMKKWLVAGIGLLLVGMGAWWVWSLGQLPAEATPAMTLQVTAEPVQVRRLSQQEWMEAKTGDTLSVGDSVRTGSGGSATVQILGNAESRLSSDTQVTIQNAQPPSSMGVPFLVNLVLESGRAWSRVLRLFDVQSTFQVHTDTVVATVRGTAFDLSKSTTGTVLWVSDSAVQVSGAEEGSLAPSPASQFTVSEGFMANFDPSGKLLQQQAISDGSRQSDWFISNTTRDSAFVQSAAQAVATQFASMRSETPGSLLDGIAKISESIHLTFAGDDAPELYARYAARRLAAIKVLMDGGRPGQALQAYSTLEEDMTTRSTGAKGDLYRRSLRRNLVPVFILLQEVVPNSPSYRFKQRLEDLNVTLAGADQIDVSYTRLLAIDARLDEASMLITTSSLDDARGLLDIARQGISNVERDIDHVPDETDATRLEAVRAKLYALKARETSIRTRLATAIQPPTNQIQITEGSTTSTSSTIETVVPTSTPSVASSTFASLSMSASPSSPVAGDTLHLTAIATDEAGSKTDVTAKTQFSLTGTAASLNGPVLSTRAAGTIILKGVFTQDGRSLTATLTISIKPKAAVLQSVTVVTQGSTVLAYNETVPILVRAQYSDGSQKDVTTLAQLTSSNSVLGYFTGSLFHAGSTAPGTDTVIATYREGNISKTSSLDIQIVAR